MNSATSTEAAAPDATLRPWQFFLLAGMLCATAVVIVATGQSPASIILLSLTVVAASLVALGAYRALAPLVVPEGAMTPLVTVARRRVALEREKTLVLRSIKELEFDFAMGKIAKGDFDEMSGKLRGRAIGLMRQLDAGEGYRDTIEQELERRIARLSSGTAEIHEAAADIHRADEDVRPENRASAGGPPMTTSDCGVANDPDARFCKNCGTKLPRGF